MAELGVIGGSGVYDIPGLDIFDSVKLSTPFGEPSDLYRIGKLSGTEVVFLPKADTRFAAKVVIVNRTRVQFMASEAPKHAPSGISQ